MSLIKARFPAWPRFTDLFEDDGFKTKFFNDNWMPAINVVDNEDCYEIEVAAPGLKKEDFNVTVEHRVLTISGSSQEESEEKSKKYTRREFSSSSFVKSFTLPSNVEEESVSAKYTDGVLRLTLKKEEQEQPSKKEVAIE